MSEDPSVISVLRICWKATEIRKKSFQGKPFHNYLHSDMPEREENISFLSLRERGNTE